MSHVLVWSLVLQVMAHHGVLWGSVRVSHGRGAHVLVLVILVVHLALAHEVLGTLVLVGSAILEKVVNEMKTSDCACYSRIDNVQQSR
jgi:hypothetical protein